ncbi:hypothetical protein KDK95_29685, partial [Actinospica sp. MGRD01-02]|nr:hypothetical protein [Actinospica acidithermotolerans]
MPAAQQPVQRLRSDRDPHHRTPPVTRAWIEVLTPGVQTAVQDLAGRRGLWGVGVPPSGAYDELSFALANLAVGNDPGAAGLEAVLAGPKLRFHVAGRGEGGGSGVGKGDS